MIQRSLFKSSSEEREDNDAKPKISGPQAFFDFSMRMFRECADEKEARRRINQVWDNNPNLLKQLNLGAKNTFSQLSSRTYGPHD
ncbi:hypothetical protein ACFL1U_01060 [Patescibacteria group bacterium]